MPAPGLEAEAIALFQAGRFAEAERAFRAIVDNNPRHADALHALGVIALQSQRFADAAAHLERAAHAQPRSFAVAYNLASALRQAGRPTEARGAFERALALNPRSAEAHLGLGNVYRDLGERTAARASFSTALGLDPALSAAEYALGLMATEEGEAAAAAARFRRVVERDPRHADAWNALGLVAQREERLDEAIACYRGALEARPGFAPALANWGNALKDQGDFEGALERYRAALAADPREPAALANCASIAAERGDVTEARRLYEMALAQRPDFANARYASSLLDLRAHDFERGWPGYEIRFEAEPPAAAIAAPRRPRVAGGLPGGQRVAVRREQGLGDQLLFSTLLPELRGRGLDVVVELDPRLVAPYRRNFPDFHFPLPMHAHADIAACDAEIPLGSLPSLFRRSVASFDRQPVALVKAEETRVEAVREALGEGPLVGIAWRSFQAFGRRHIAERKSIPLAAFAGLADAGVRLLDLQYGDVAEERAAFDASHPNVRVEVASLDRRDDLEGLLAAIEACELVVTASNVTAHLAGVLGKRTWLVYLGANPPFHYWAPRGDGRSLWYPSVEVVTDPGWTRWQQAFDAVARRLADRTNVP